MSCVDEFECDLEECRAIQRAIGWLFADLSMTFRSEPASRSVKTKCLEQATNLSDNERSTPHRADSFFYFDIKTRYLFRSDVSRKILANFRISRRLLAPFMSVILRASLNSRYVVYNNLVDDVFPLQVDIIGLGPLFSTGGSQIKVVDVNNRQVLCMISDSATQWLVENEMYAYSQYNDIDCVPSLIDVLCPHIYIRELVIGPTLSVRRKGWQTVVRHALDDLAKIYTRSGIRERSCAMYIEPMLQHLSRAASDNSAIMALITALARHVKSKCPEDIYNTRVHGDFALKNILQRQDGHPVLIDWERHICRSIMYDICNLIFKLDHWRDVAFSAFLYGYYQQMLYEWICAVEVGCLLNNGLESHFIGYYALFLLERLDLELQIHGSLNTLRSQQFLDFWVPHVSEVLGVIEKQCCSESKFL